MKKNFLYFLLLCFNIQIQVINAQSFKKNQNHGKYEAPPSDIIKLFAAEKSHLHNNPPYFISQDGSFFVEIYDINRFLYSISITEQQKDLLDDTQIDEAKPNQFIDPVKFNLSNLNLRYPNFILSMDNSDLNKKQKEINDAISKLEKSYDSLSTNERNLYNNQVRTTNLQGLIDTLKKQQTNSSLSEVQKQDILNSIRTYETQKDNINYNSIDYDKALLLRNDGYTKLENKKKELQDIENQINGLNPERERLQYQIATYRKALLDLDKLADFYSSLRCILYTSATTFQEINNLKDLVINREFPNQDNIKDIDFVKRKCKERLNKVYEEFIELEKIYFQISNNYGDRVFKEMFNSVKIFHEQIDKGKYEFFFESITTLIKAFNKDNFFISFKTLITSENADRIVYTIRANPIDNPPCAVSANSVAFSYEVHLKHGVKIDVSTGIFANFGLANNTYHFETTTEFGKDITKVIQDKNENSLLPAAGVFLNIYKRSPANTKLGWSVGVNTSDAKKINFLTGPAIIFGRSQRFIVHFGLATGQVNVIDSKYEVNKPINVSAQSLPAEVPLRNPAPFKIGYFLGFSFNLSTTNNKQTLSKFTTLAGN